MRDGAGRAARITVMALGASALALILRPGGSTNRLVGGIRLGV